MGSVEVTPPRDGGAEGGGQTASVGTRQCHYHLPELLSLRSPWKFSVFCSFQFSHMEHIIRNKTSQRSRNKPGCSASTCVRQAVPAVPSSALPVTRLRREARTRVAGGITCCSRNGHTQRVTAAQMGRSMCWRLCARQPPPRCRANFANGAIVSGLQCLFSRSTLLSAT